MKRYIIATALALVFSTAAYTPPVQAQVAAPLNTFITLTDAQVAARQTDALKWWKSTVSPSATEATAMAMSLAAAQNWVIAQKDGINRRANFITALKMSHSFNTTAIATYGFPTIAAKDAAKSTILGILTGAPAPKRDNFAAALVANPFFTDSPAYIGNTATYLAAYGFSSDAALKTARKALLDILMSVPKTYGTVRMD